MTGNQALTRDLVQNNQLSLQDIYKTIKGNGRMLLIANLFYGLRWKEGSIKTPDR